MRPSEGQEWALVVWWLSEEQQPVGAAWVWVEKALCWRVWLLQLLLVELLMAFH